jgi:hypothetical protein
MRDFILSKSTFVRGCQCYKSLYLHKHYPELRGEIDEQQESLFERGTTVGELAQQLFKGGINAKPETAYEYGKAAQLTRELIEKGQKIIYEATFIFDEVMCAIDILVNKNNQWYAYEVKSSTSVKETHILDTSLQYYVITNSGIHLADISVVYINNEYRRIGELDLDELFAIDSVKEQVIEKQQYIKEEIIKQKELIAQSDIPKMDIGSHCSDPYECDFYGHCWQHVPEYSVFNISKLNSEKKFELYHKGILDLKDIPEDYPLNDKQWLQVNSEVNKTSSIEKKEINLFLKELSYPLYYMDFETIMPAIPMFDYNRPYQQIPFQYSLHYQETKGSEIIYFEFIAENNGDPRIPFIEKLLKDTKEPALILVYNKAFEITRLKEIAEDFPIYANEINERISRIVDLMLPFQKKQYYTPEMQGSYSIKKVLPALVPQLSYDNLEINNGGNASAAFEQLYYEKDKEIVNKTRNNLLRYCKLDTLAMVEILKVLQKV